MDIQEVEKPDFRKASNSTRRDSAVCKQHVGRRRAKLAMLCCDGKAGTLPQYLPYHLQRSLAQISAVGLELHEAWAGECVLEQLLQMHSLTHERSCYHDPYELLQLRSNASSSFKILMVSARANFSSHQL
eukprot:4993349-Amphidinium_carterae.1